MKTETEIDTAALIKEELISKILSSPDLNFLKALKTLLGTSNQTLFELAAEQKTSFEIGEEEIKAGKSNEHSQIVSEMKEWLEKK